MSMSAVSAVMADDLHTRFVHAAHRDKNGRTMAAGRIGPRTRLSSDRTQHVRGNMYYSIRYEFIAGAPIESADASSAHNGRRHGVVTRCNSPPLQARRGAM